MGKKEPKNWWWAAALKDFLTYRSPRWCNDFFLFFSSEKSLCFLLLLRRRRFDTYGVEPPRLYVTDVLYARTQHARTSPMRFRTPREEEEEEAITALSGSVSFFSFFLSFPKARKEEKDSRSSQPIIRCAGRFFCSVSLIHPSHPFSRHSFAFYIVIPLVLFAPVVALLPFG